MIRRRKRKRGHEDVNLNLAAMLDMAFQLLAFFILTFKPNPAEAQLKLNLPAPSQIAPAGVQPLELQNRPDDFEPTAAKTLTITIVSGQNGQAASVSVGLAKLFDGPLELSRMRQLDRRLKEVFAIQGSPFDQVVLRVGRNLHYGELMKIVEVCTRQKMADGTVVNKVSFVEVQEK